MLLIDVGADAPGLLDKALMGLAMRLLRDKRGSLATIFPLSNGNDVIIP